MDAQGGNAGPSMLPMTLTDIRSRVFGRREIRDLVVVLSEGFTHSELTMHVDTYGIPGVPPDNGGTSKQKRATSIVRALLERGWPEGDEALLDLLHQAKDSRYASETLAASRSALDGHLLTQNGVVFATMAGWKLRAKSESTSSQDSLVGGNGVESQGSIANGSHNYPQGGQWGSGNSFSDAGAPLAGESTFEPAWETGGTSSGAVSGVEASISGDQTSHPSTSRPTAFVVHGRDNEAAKAVRTFLRGVHMEILTWDRAKEMCDLSPTTWEIVQMGISRADIIVVVLSGDDQACLRPDLASPSDPEWETVPNLQPRQNVLLEAGIALGSAYNKTVLVRTQRLREISDLSGFHWVTMNGTAEARNDFLGQLKKALKAAGFADPLRNVPHMWDNEALGEFRGTSPSQ